MILVVTKRMSLTHRAQIFMRCCAEQLVAVHAFGLVFVVVDNAVGQACDWLGFRCG